MRYHGEVVLSILLGAGLALSADAATLVVTTAAFVVNGDLSSPAALIANPGPDGISLAEAVGAANNQPGPHTISFSAALAGQTIHPAYGLDIRRDGVTITGFNDAGGKPSITLELSGLTSPALVLLASDFKLSRIRMINLADTFGVWVNAGVTGTYQTPTEARNITIEENEFSNESVATSRSIPVTVGTDASSSGAKVLNVHIARNTFTHFRIAPGESGGDGIHLHADGQGSLIQNVRIEGNTFTDLNYPVELVVGQGANNRIVGTQIFDNTFVTSDSAINLNMISNGSLTGNTFEDTDIVHNEIHHTSAAITLIAGIFNATGNGILNTRIDNNVITDTPEGYGNGNIGLFAGILGSNENVIDGVRIRKNILQRGKGPAIEARAGADSSSDNTVQNVEIVNNLITDNSDNGGISLAAGIASSNLNRLQNVSIVNNTIANIAGEAFSAIEEIGGTGNVLANVVIANTVFWNNGVDVTGVDPSQVFASILQPPGFAGTNGNLADDPAFVNAPGGDFHLSPASPALDSGTVAGAPADDLECRPRLAPPDMGAYEHGETLSGCLPFVVFGDGFEAGNTSAWSSILP